jgi:hypothetical protein
MTDKPPRRRRWVPITLRVLVVFLLLFAVASPYVGMRIYRQQAAINVIKGAGGFFVYRREAPSWLRSSFGDAVASPERVILLKTPWSADLARQVANVESLTWIESIDVGFTDADLIHLAKLRACHFLILNGASISDGGLRSLKNMMALQFLDLSQTRITGKGLEHLSSLSALEGLGLAGTPVDDPALINLAKFSRLHNVSLNDTAITDVGASHLADISSLFFLDLRNTHITDAGLEHLGRIPRLSEIDLRGTDVTNPGIDNLRRALPHLHVFCDDSGEQK